MYIAASALRISSSAPAAASPSAIEMPRLQRTNSSLPSSSSGAASDSRIRSAVSAASCALPTSSSRTANSSPPKRAAVSLGRMLRVQALGDLEQHRVAGGVAEAVVDRLEVVEVHEDDGQPRALAARARDRVADALDEQRAVGEVGDGVVEGLVGELLLERLALADVAAVEHDAVDVLVVEQVGVEHLELAHARRRAWRSAALERLGAGGACAAGSARTCGRRPSSPGCRSRSKRVPTSSSGV